MIENRTLYMYFYDHLLILTMPKIFTNHCASSSLKLYGTQPLPSGHRVTRVWLSPSHTGKFHGGA